MDKLIIFLEDIKKYKSVKGNTILNLLGDNKNRNETTETKLSQSLYKFLLYQALNLKIENEHLFIYPNYDLIDFKLKLFFKNNKQIYEITIDGKNKNLVTNNISLTNINRVCLKFLITKQNVLDMF